MISPEQAEDWASDFAQSTPYSFLPDAVKGDAPAVCAAFLREAADLDDDAVSRAMLEKLPALDLPAAVRAAVPEIVRAFLEWLQDAGRLGDGYSLGLRVGALAKGYAERCSPKGGLRVPPVVNKGVTSGRNDPCPCGSGSKFKKCCGR
jgi:hypothetical protein